MVKVAAYAAITITEAAVQHDGIGNRESPFSPESSKSNSEASKNRAYRSAFGRFLPVAAGVLVASYVAIAHAARESCRRFWAPILNSNAPWIGSLHIGPAQKR